MDFDQLRSFAAVAGTGSFTRAARDLQLSQPAVSRHVQRLEREVGAILIDRGPGGPRLTVAGQSFLAYTEIVLAGYQRVLADLRGTVGDLAGALQIAASTTPGEFLVPTLVAGFTRRFPGVQPDIHIADSTEVIGLIEGGQWAIGFTGARFPRSSLVYRVVAQDEIVLVVPANHSFAGRGEIDLAELADQPMIEREGGSGTLLSIRRAIADRGLTLPRHRIAMLLSSSQAIVTTVQRGLGIGFVSSLALAGRSVTEIAVVRLAGLPLRRDLFLVYDERRAGQPIVRAFIDFVFAERTET